MIEILLHRLFPSASINMSGRTAELQITREKNLGLFLVRFNGQSLQISVIYIDLKYIAIYNDLWRSYVKHE